jgi:hypothetical protein
MDENSTTKTLLAQRRLTRALGQIVAEQMLEYVTTLTPLFRQRAVFGSHLQGIGAEVPKAADQAFKELQELYESVAPRAPFGLSRELQSPLMQMTSTLELSPWEYVHVARTAEATKSIQVSSPFKSVLTYAGYEPRRLRELLANRNRDNGELQICVLHYLAMHLVVNRQPGIAQLFSTLHFPLSTERRAEFGNLPITCIASAVGTRLPPDAVVIESTELSGMDVFEEVVDVAEVEALRDSLKERLQTAIRDSS